MNVDQIRARIDHPIIDSDGHLIEYLPVVRDILREQAGDAAVTGLDFVTSAGRFMRTLTPEQMRAQAFVRSPWWGLPARNSLDRGTALLPALLAERLDEIGIDHAVLYPTYGLVPTNLDDGDLRRAVARAFNTFYAEEFRDHRDEADAGRRSSRCTRPRRRSPSSSTRPACSASTRSCSAVRSCGPCPASSTAPRAGSTRSASTASTTTTRCGQRCVELDIAPTFHTPSMGWATHSSPTNYVYNHIGMFATGGEAVARSLFLGGVLHRFPTLRFAFLEGGVAWGASLYSGLVGHFEKRNREAVEHYNPKHLDRELLVELFGKYGSDRYRARIDQLDDGLRFLSDPDETNLDEFAQSGVKSAEDIKAMFERFYFGCEADDPLTAVAFDTDRNPLGARLKPIFASDIGHWDVPDIREVLPEAWELVEHGHIDEEEFRAFTYDNARALWPKLGARFA